MFPELFERFEYVEQTLHYVHICFSVKGSLALKRMAELTGYTIHELRAGLVGSDDQLIDALNAMLSEATARWGADYEAVPLLRRMLGSACREMKRYEEAESYDRLDQSGSYFSVMALARDLSAQMKPEDLPELKALYRQAIALDEAADLEMSTRRYRVGGHRANLAEAMLAAGECEEAQREIDTVIALNDQAVGEGSHYDGLDYPLIQALKVLLQMDRLECQKAVVECVPFDRSRSGSYLRLAMAVVARVMKQTETEPRTRLHLIETLSGTSPATTFGEREPLGLFA